MTAARSEETGLITLGEVLGALRRRWWMVAGFAVLGLLASAGMVLRSSSSFTAESQLVIDPITTDPFAANSRPVDAVNPTTERNVLLGTAVAEEVIDRLDLDTTTSDLLGRVDAENPEGSLTLKVSTTASTPERAQALADAFAAVYLEQRRAIADESVAAVVQTIDGEIAATEEELGAAITESARAASTGSAVAVEEAEAQVATLRTRLGTLESRRTDLVSATTSPGRITRVADLPSTPGGLPPVVLGAGVFMVFLSLGVVAAVLYDRRGGRLRDPSGIEAVAPGAEVHVLTKGGEGMDDTIGSLALSVLASAPVPAIGALCSTDQGSPGVAADRLAVALVASGHRPLVVWTGARGELPPARRGVPVLERLCDGDADCLEDDSRDSVWIVPESGAGATALARPRAAASIRAAAEACGLDVVVLVTPSPHYQPAVAAVARYLDRVVLVAKGYPRRSDLVATVSTLAASGVSVDEVVAHPESAGYASWPEPTELEERGPEERGPEERGPEDRSPEDRSPEGSAPAGPPPYRIAGRSAAASGDAPAEEPAEEPA